LENESGKVQKTPIVRTKKAVRKRNQHFQSTEIIFLSVFMGESKLRIPVIIENKKAPNPGLELY